VLNNEYCMSGLDNICYPETLGKMIIINAPYIAVQTWGVVKRWLDPRTQQKIEILGPGPESIARLHEFISPENLPPAYGGTGPEIFHKKENVVATSVPRAGRLQKTIDVPPGKRLSVDSYVTEGPVELTITFTSAAAKMSQGLSPPVTMRPPATHDEGPARNKQIVPASSELRHVTITWSNASKFSSRPLVYVLELLDDN
jgi:CRAL/TRIO domain